MDTIELTEEQISSIRERFNAYDTSGNGHIPTDKLGDVMRSFGHKLRKHQLRDLVDVVDTDGSGTIEWEEFLPLVAAKMKEQEDEAFYKNLFRMLDKKNKGFVKCDDLKKILYGMAQQVALSEEEVDNMVEALDERGTGQVRFEEFLKLMTTE